MFTAPAGSRIKVTNLGGKTFIDLSRQPTELQQRLQESAYKAPTVAVPTGISKCGKKGHRPRNKYGICTRCGT